MLPWLSSLTIKAVFQICVIIRIYPFALAYQSGSFVSFSLASFVIISKAGCVLSQDRVANELCRIFSTSLATSSK